ncbi:MAG: hypothetical protein JW395_0374 [Nitrospira sp.]|nr:hypothetical protein [Nitrospira sp.]
MIAPLLPPSQFSIEHFDPLELLAPEEPPAFSFYPGQLDYLARVGIKDGALVAADTGCGKSLMAVALARLKLETKDGTFDGRCLIVAPGGTLRVSTSEDDETGDSDEPEVPASQWRQEIARFAPDCPVYPIKSWDEYQSHLLPDGSMPKGIWVTYYEACFRNNARESIPGSWTNAHERLCKQFNDGNMGPTVRSWAFKGGVEFWCRESDLPHSVRHGTSLAVGVKTMYPFVNGSEEVLVIGYKDTPLLDYSAGVGDEQYGIRCIVTESLIHSIESDQKIVAWNRHWKQFGTLEGFQSVPSCLDMVVLDEAHVCTNLDAQVTQSLIRLQPKYRFGCTATPIPNVISNLFSLMGWICVPEWFKGEKRNTAWPYARAELARFNVKLLQIGGERIGQIMHHESH